ncbi:Vms1/Ankzf1 family peptidyl-tRNA hydrolase [Cellulomonas sp. NPDC058312]|uniref:baeRF2 domain-containing protein n=1 Tax=Cellulomonas sp. NPDC058312 TaxID=3346441 RepID=UPI0036EA372D
MELHWLKPLLGRPAPFVTVHLDATRADASGDEEVAGRWRSLRRDLERAGAAAGVLDEIEQVVTRPTGVTTPHGRVVIADSRGVVVDRVLKSPPAQSTAVLDDVPVLLPAVRAADEATRFLLVEIDRQGADLTWSDGSGVRGSSKETVEGDHDVLHKVKEGGGAWAHKRVQVRAEDSWERNAETVAADLDKQVVEKKPEIVLVTGDVRAVSLLCHAVAPRTRELVVEVQGGSRADGVNQQAFHQRVSEALETFRRTRRTSVLDRYREALGRGEAAVTSVDDVVTVLQRGQVAEVVLHEDATLPGSSLSERRLWVGPEPLQIASSESDLAGIGVTSGARQMPADVALIRAALGQDAGLTIASDGQVEVVDGIGAVLRWSDDSTPSESIPTQSDDQSRLRDVV